MFKAISKLSVSKNLSHVLRRNISVGDKLPNASVAVLEYQNGKYEKRTANINELFGKGSAVLVGFPGAFTPTCQTEHLPEYIKHASDMKNAGVAHTYAITVNDAFVVKAFAEQLNASDKLSFIADDSGEFIKALDAGVNLGDKGLGYRSRRFSMLIKDGKVVQFNDEKGPGMTDMSRVTKVLSQAKSA